jgi:hypothetical protein
MRQESHVACTINMRNALGRLWHTWKYNIKIDLKETG